ncbi:MAG TPA: DUF427 domain-containing protein [Natronosporangium sp.]
MRAFLGGQLVADSYQPWLVWEVPYYPAYYLPIKDVRAELVPTGRAERSPSRGDGTVYTVRVGGSEAVDAALRYEDSPIPELRDLVRLDWDAMDAWFEEDEEVFTHPRSPYHRIDILDSSRHVRIEVAGVTVAESSRPRVLFETNLPPRFYLPKPDLRLDLLEPSDHRTRCPYKGEARYYSVRIGDTLHPNLAWYYPSPLLESVKIAGLVAFWDEKVDVYLDGVRQDRPKTPFS